MSRTVIGDALDLLQASYGIADRNMAFAVFRLISQQHNVKLREVATMFVFGQVDAQARTDQALASKKGRQDQEPPVLSFPVRAPRPTEVLQALMRSVQAQTSAIHMTVQASDRLSGGLWIQAQHGFDRPFLDFFGYVDTADASACASALSDAQPVLVDDVEASGIFDESSRQVMLKAGSLAVVSVPLVDAEDVVCGVVSAHYTEARVSTGPRILRAVQRQAQECARWLGWHDRVVMPPLMTAVHHAASAAAQISADRPSKKSAPDAVSGAQAMLMNRYALTASQALALLAKLGSANHIGVKSPTTPSPCGPPI